MGCIPLFLAAEAGNTAVCKELLSQCAESQLNQQRKVGGVLIPFFLAPPKTPFPEHLIQSDSFVAIMILNCLLLTYFDKPLLQHICVHHLKEILLVSWERN